MNIISKHPFNGEYIGAIKKIYKWDEPNPYDKIDIYKSDGKMENYPVAAKILEDIDSSLLLKEFYEHEKNLKPTTGTYLKYWFDKRNVNWEQAKKELTEVNFVPEEHRQFNIMELKPNAESVSEWTEFFPWVESYTRQVLESFKSKVIRARYSIADPGWVLRPHIDFPHPKNGGFRLHIPLLTEPEVETFFLINDEWCQVYFEPNCVWYMNVSVPHKINHKGKLKRIYLTFDFWDDLDIPTEKQIHKINYLPDQYK